MLQVNFKPILHTARLTLRIYDAAKDAAFAAPFLSLTVEQMQLLDKGVRLHKSLFGGDKTPGPAHYVIHLGSTTEGPQIGLLSMCHRKEGFPPDIGWTVKPEHRNKGFATEAATECLRYYHEECGLKEICAITGKDNIASHKVAQHIGLVRKGDVKMIGRDRSTVEEYYAWGLKSMKDFHGEVISFWGDLEEAEKA